MTPRLDDLDPITAADRWTVDTFVNCYLRELAPGAVTDRPPIHDDALAALWRRAGAAGWIRIPFDAARVDVHAPIDYRSATGRHRFGRPLVARTRGEDALRVIDLLDLFDLAVVEYRSRAPLGDETVRRLSARLLEGRDNLADILARRRGAPPTATSFLAAEQAMLAGHPFHPLAKSRWGFTPDDVRRYSPEHAGAFALCWFLAHPSLVVAEPAGGPAELASLRDELAREPRVRDALARHPGWLLLPAHPWEADHLLGDPTLRAAIDRGLVVALGAAGRPWAATSSVRTVYRDDLPFMLKLSLHVAITNNQRVNQLHELRKGAGVAKLLGGAAGARLREDARHLRILDDASYVALALDGEVVAGLSTTLRDNPFDGSQRAVVAGALCEPSLVGPSPLRRLITSLATRVGVEVHEAARRWLDRYLALLFHAVVGAHDRHGLSLEAHLQNLGIELDADGWPERLFFRDNQGFFVREALHSPVGLEDAGPCVLPDRLLEGPIRYYLLVNNVLGFVQAIGAEGLCDEESLLAIVDHRLSTAAADDCSGLVRDVVRARAWPAKGNLRMVLEDQDELERPVESPAPYIEVDNPILPRRHRASAVVAPGGRGIVLERRYADYDAPLTLRPLDLDRDVTLLHAWVHHERARQFWDLAGPLRDVEAYYAEMLASPSHHAFLGCYGDEPTFLIETYWAPGDVVGRHTTVEPDDHGLHLLVGPPTTRRPRFTRRALQVGTELLLREPQVARVLAEPDRRNAKAHRVFRDVGYRVAGPIQLPDKLANLLVCTRDTFPKGDA
jgi:siderophore synthetase component/RimJ/RimL family protein N-acetyltransferase